MLLGFFLVVCFVGAAKAGDLIYMPFKKGEKWYCSQGNNENFSHSGKLAYAYDFTRGSSGDAFGKSVFSPIKGRVTTVVNNTPDYYRNDEIASGIYPQGNNGGWGNEVVIQDLETGKYLKFTHLKHASIPSNIYVNTVVEIGQKIGEVGCSGRSSGPHLHLQMQSSGGSNVQSLKFDFVEGPITAGKYFNSELEAKSFVLDDSSDKSLSHEVSYYAGTKTSTFQTSPTAIPNTTVGQKSYRAKVTSSSSTSPNYKWSFTLKTAGFFFIYVKCECGSDKDPKARYLIYSSDDPDIYTEVVLNQQVCTSDKWNFLIGTALKKNRTYHIRVTGKTVNKNISADAVKFVRLW